jgi:hypothetical protein
VPLFMDYHDDLKLPAEAILEIAQGTRDGATDQFGVRQVELYHNADGKVYCLLEGPDEQAVRDHHAALGVPCGDVNPVNKLLLRVDREAEVDAAVARVEPAGRDRLPAGVEVDALGAMHVRVAE